MELAERLEAMARERGANSETIGRPGQAVVALERFGHVRPKYPSLTCRPALPAQVATRETPSGATAAQAPGSLSPASREGGLWNNRAATQRREVGEFIMFRFLIRAVLSVSVSALSSCPLQSDNPNGPAPFVYNPPDH